jgi:hypothetical protein
MTTREEIQSALQLKKKKDAFNVFLANEQLDWKSAQVLNVLNTNKEVWEPRVDTNYIPGRFGSSLKTKCTIGEAVTFNTEYKSLYSKIKGFINKVKVSLISGAIIGLIDFIIIGYYRK